MPKKRNRSGSMARSITPVTEKNLKVFVKGCYD
jgi:hypothetical protein